MAEPLDPVGFAQFDQAAAAFRNTAELLGEFRRRLIEEHFTEEGAEAVCLAFAEFVLEQ